MIQPDKYYVLEGTIVLYLLLIPINIHVILVLIYGLSEMMEVVIVYHALQENIVHLAQVIFQDIAVKELFVYQAPVVLMNTCVQQEHLTLFITQLQAQIV